MTAAKRAGRTVGIVIIVQMVGGFLVNFFLEAPLFGTPGFLVNGAPHASQVAVAALSGLVTEGLWLVIAVTMFSFFWKRSPELAVGFIALAAVLLAAAVFESAGVMSLLSASQAYAEADEAGRGQFELVRVVVASARNWAHFIARILDGITLFVFYAGMYRHALIPRLLAGLGLIAVLLMISVLLMPFFGHGVIFPLLAPLGLSQLILAVWLMVKGLRDEQVLED
jgi:Domain of unknown function (DUF4386)